MQTFAPLFLVEPEIESEQNVNERGKQNIDVSGTHEQAKILRNDVFVGKIGAHQSARDQKDDENDDAE